MENYIVYVLCTHKEVDFNLAIFSATFDNRFNLIKIVKVSLLRDVATDWDVVNKHTCIKYIPP